jgi:hypothetical protein
MGDNEVLHTKKQRPVDSMAEGVAGILERQTSS